MDLKGLSDSLSSRAQQSVCDWFVLDADADFMVDLQGLSEKLNKPFARGGRFPRAERFLPNLSIASPGSF